MKKILFLLVSISLFARENPFVSVVENNNNQQVKKEYFSSKEINLPSDARNLQYIIFEYKSLTGTIKKYKVPINKAINWHNSIIISTKIKKAPTISLDLSVLSLYIKNHTLLVQTDDKLLRQFTLVEPNRLVLDFKSNRNFLVYKKEAINSFIKKVIVGNHNGYYRVVLYLDAKYKTEVINTPEGFLIDFK